MFEIIMSHDLAIALGARPPASVQDHRALRRDGTHWLIRTRESLPLFWPVKAALTQPST